MSRNGSGNGIVAAAAAPPSLAHEAHQRPAIAVVDGNCVAGWHMVPGAHHDWPCGSCLAFCGMSAPLDLLSSSTQFFCPMHCPPTHNPQPHSLALRPILFPVVSGPSTLCHASPFHAVFAGPALVNCATACRRGWWARPLPPWPCFEPTQSHMSSFLYFFRRATPQEPALHQFSKPS